MRKTISTYLKICLFTLFLVLGGMASLYAANRYAVANGNWNSTSTWSATSGGSSGASVPVNGDNVYIERGYTVTVTANAACTNLYFSTAANGNFGTLTVNSGVTLTVSGEVTLYNAANADVSATISGGGTLSCITLNIGNATSATGNNTTRSHTLTSTIAVLNVSGNSTINSYFSNNNRIRNGVFILTSGTVTVNGTVTTSNANTANTSTLTLGNSSPILNLAGGTPFNLSGTGTNTITLNGIGATVDYTGGAQPILATNYWNLTLSGSGNKTLSGTATILGNFTNNNLLSSGSFNIVITGTAATQSIAGFTTTGTVSMTKTSGTATFTGNVSASAFSLNGAGGTLNCGSGLTHTFTGTFDLTAGTLQGASSTIKINGTPGAATGNWEEGTSTIDYGGTNQTIFATTYYNLLFSSGTKSLSASANIFVKGNFTNKSFAFQKGLKIREKKEKKE